MKKPPRKSWAVIALSTLALSLSVQSASAAVPRTRRVSIKSNGNEAVNGDSLNASLSASGRFIAFESEATNLVPGDGGDRDVFVHDRATKKTKIVSVRSNGDHAVGGQSESPSVSANGRFVAFASSATNLAPGDGGDYDVFVHDRQTGRTVLVSKSSQGDHGTGTSSRPSISANGRRVAFESHAANLVGNDNNPYEDIFVRNLQTDKTRRVNLRSNGDEADDGSSEDAEISANGRVVVFESHATNLVSNDGNMAEDVFVHSMKSGNTFRVSIRSNEDEADSDSGDPSISATARFVAFESTANNLAPDDGESDTDIFVRNRVTGKTKVVSIRSNGDEGTGGDSDQPAISDSGRFVAFQSSMTNLVGNDTNAKSDIFVHNRENKRTKRVSVQTDGDEVTDGDASTAAISADARFVAFESDSSTLVNNDGNGYFDVFRRGPLR
jgi:hypothetical protein